MGNTKTTLHRLTWIIYKQRIIFRMTYQEPATHHVHHSHHPHESREFSEILDELTSVQLIKLTLDSFNDKQDSNFYYWLAAIPLMILAIFLISMITGYCFSKGVRKYKRINNSSDSE